MKLSRIERIILINQYKILNALKPGTCNAELSALRGNFELALDWVFQPVSEKSVSLVWSCKSWLSIPDGVPRRAFELEK